MAFVKNHIELTSLEHWEHLAGPKSTDQWVDGRSAKEVARAWLEGDGRELPVEVTTALAQHKAFGPVESWEAEPEAKLPFDTFAGETRNSDLAVHARDRHGSFLIAVEAKADEPFGDTVAETLATALERYLESSRSKGVLRVQQLAQALFGGRKPHDPKVGDVRYQLLTACAGSLCEAERRGYARALVLVHEFITDKTLDEKHRRNSADLDTFLQRLSHGAVKNVRSGEVRGPFVVPGAPLETGQVELFVGKVGRNLRQGDV